MRTIEIDCASVRTEAEFWQRYLDIVRPQGADIFGRNLDAFDDALAGGPGCPGEIQLRFIHTSHLKRLRAGAFLESLKEIISDYPSISLS
ncbi:MAG: barstar family protein [Hyphomonadaceae bacterium]|nr:barstar family protein [Hyphomonadaceae bacterium]